jgi:hypothetical protein
MRRFLLILCALMVGHEARTMQAQQITASVAALSLPQYVAALDDACKIAQQLKDDPTRAADLLQAVPEGAWHVEADGRGFEIPTTALRRDIEKWKKQNDDAVLRGIVEQLQSLRANAEAYQDSALNGASRRELLDRILARREFGGVHGPTWLDRLKLRLFQFLIRLLGKAFASSAIPAISDIVVYGLMVVAVIGVAFWMYRSIREGANLETIMPRPVPVSAKEWPIWLREARAAAGRADWRAAVHLAYWSGISFLEAQGAWKADSARTPREYLRLLPAGSERQPALRSLTGKLELVWYGMGDATPEMFQETLYDLERLGCPCN